MEKRDFTAFKTFSEQDISEKARVIFYHEYSRELVEEYQESVFIIHKPNSSPASCVDDEINCRIDIISQKNLIIYFYIEIDKGLDSANNNGSSTEFRFSDSARLAALRSKFQKTFLAPLNEEDLFINNIRYCTTCNMVGELTKQ